MVIPKTLSVNAAQDATDLVAKLRACHSSSQTDSKFANLKWYFIAYFFTLIVNRVECLRNANPIYFYLKDGLGFG